MSISTILSIVGNLRSKIALMSNHMNNNKTPNHPPYPINCCYSTSFTHYLCLDLYNDYHMRNISYTRFYLVIVHNLTISSTLKKFNWYFKKFDWKIKSLLIGIERDNECQEALLCATFLPPTYSNTQEDRRLRVAEKRVTLSLTSK